ncbi:hypothetical protein BJX99DRAFT_242884 [Aspergillus californicus]
MELVTDPLAGCHLCYFHMRIFGEADLLYDLRLGLHSTEQPKLAFINCTGHSSWDQGRAFQRNEFNSIHA